MLPSQSPSIYTVSRLNQSVRLLLEREMGQVWISGEISNFSQPSSGHWYFTLKDDNAQVRCAMFRNSNRRVTFRPQHGQQVLVRANITLYEPRGDYQIIVESMQPAGEGLLQQKYEQLKAALAAEGLFDQQHKKALPSPAHCIGVITSKTGAALHIVHVGSSGITDVPEVLKLIDASKAAGMDLTTEVYPYTAASTALESAMFNPGWQDNLKISYGDLAWAATGERLTQETFESYRKQGGWVIIYMMKDENVEKAIAHPGVMIASDGIPFVDGKGHPRGAGTFARVLGHYSREKKLLPLMDALAKMTILPAKRLEGHVPMMKNKGRIAIGADADITVFDPATITDRATFEAPTTPSAGIPHVLVNGGFVVRDGELVKDARPGRAVIVTP